MSTSLSNKHAITTVQYNKTKLILCSQFRGTHKHLCGKSRILLENVRKFLNVTFSLCTYAFSSRVRNCGIVSNLAVAVLEGRMQEDNENVVAIQ